MFDSIKKIVAHYYGIHVLSVEAKSKTTYLLYYATGRVVLKKVAKLNESTFPLKLSFFVSIIPTLDHQDYVLYQNEYYFLIPFVSLQENGISHLSTALNQLAQIHQTTFYTSQVDARFYSYEIQQIKDKLTTCFHFFDQLMDALLENSPYHPAIFQLIYLYPHILKLKDISVSLLTQYQKDVQEKKTCRMCLAMNKISFENYSPVENCWIGKEHTSFERVGKDIVEMLRLSIEFENIEQFYFPYMTLYDEEKRWILLQLLCLETWDFFRDAYESVERLYQLENYFNKLNKIMNYLQIDGIVLYNE